MRMQVLKNTTCQSERSSIHYAYMPRCIVLLYFHFFLFSSVTFILRRIDFSANFWLIILIPPYRYVSAIVRVRATPVLISWSINRHVAELVDDVVPLIHNQRHNVQFWEAHSRCWEKNEKRHVLPLVSIEVTIRWDQGAYTRHRQRSK